MMKDIKNLKFLFVLFFCLSSMTNAITVKESIYDKGLANMEVENIYDNGFVKDLSDNGNVTSGIRLGDRWQTYNTLIKLFSNGEENSDVGKLIEKYVTEYPNFFGGACNPYEFAFSPSDIDLTLPTRIRVDWPESFKTMCKDIGEIQVPYLVHGISRIALMVKFCHEAINLDDVMEKMEGIACANNDCYRTGFSKKSINNLFKHFYPYVELKDEDKDGLYEVLCDKSTTSKIILCNKSNSVKAFALALCQDPNYLNF